MDASSVRSTVGSSSSTGSVCASRSTCECAGGGGVHDDRIRVLLTPSEGRVEYHRLGLSQALLRPPDEQSGGTGARRMAGSTCRLAGHGTRAGRQQQGAGAGQVLPPPQPTWTCRMQTSRDTMAKPSSSKPLPCSKGGGEAERARQCQRAGAGV